MKPKVGDIIKWEVDYTDTDRALGLDEQEVQYFTIETVTDEIVHYRLKGGLDAWLYIDQLNKYHPGAGVRVTLISESLIEKKSHSHKFL